MQITTESRKVLSNLVKKNHITNDDFLNFFCKKELKTQIRKLIKKQYEDIDLQKIQLFSYNLLCDMATYNNVMKSTEIMIISLLMKNGFTLTRKEIQKKSNYKESILTINAIDCALRDLVEDKIILNIRYNGNEKLYFLSKDFILKYIQND